MLMRVVISAVTRKCGESSEKNVRDKGLQKRRISHKETFIYSDGADQS